MPDAVVDDDTRFIFPRVLHPVSPRMADGDLSGPQGNPIEDVSRAQRLLFKNRFTEAHGQDPEEGGGEFYFADEPRHRDDAGRYGSFSAKAASKARFWLGYPKRGRNAWRRKKFDQELADYLTGAKPLSKLMQRRRRRRIKRAQEQGIGKAAMAAARKHAGERENPSGSNKCATTKWYGFIGPYCLMGISRAYVEAKSRLFKRGSKFAYNPTLYHLVKAGEIDGMEFIPLSKAKTGDICQWDWNNGTEPPDHASLFVSEHGDSIVSFDFNWNDGVGEQTHAKTNLMDIIRVFD